MLALRKAPSRPEAARACEAGRHLNEGGLSMSRMIAASVGVLALSLAAADARAEERASDDAGRAAAVDRTDSSVVDTVKDRSATETAGPADALDFASLSDDELAVLEKAAAMNPEL